MQALKLSKPNKTDPHTNKKQKHSTDEPSNTVMNIESGDNTVAIKKVPDKCFFGFSSVSDDENVGDIDEKDNNEEKHVDHVLHKQPDSNSQTYSNSKQK